MRSGHQARSQMRYQLESAGLGAERAVDTADSDSDLAATTSQVATEVCSSLLRLPACSSSHGPFAESLLASVTSVTRVTFRKHWPADLL